MSHVIPLSEVNQFLPQEKLELADPANHDLVRELEDSAKDIAFARLRPVFDVSTWVDPDTTPSLVRNIIGLFVAGWLYERQFSEEVANAVETYGSRRLAEARDLLNMLVAGELGVDGIVPVEGVGEPSIYETEPLFVIGTAF